MGFLNEFREFIQRGNVIDLAVGVIMGAAFGRVVSALVDGVLMPPIGLATGGVDFRDLRLAIGGSEAAPVTLNYGAFLQTVVDFVIVSFCVFLLVKAVNQLRRPAPAPEAPTVPEDVKLLTEIRDLLKNS